MPKKKKKIVHALRADLRCLFCILALEHLSILQQGLRDLQALMSLTFSSPDAEATDHFCVGNCLFAKAKRITQAP